MKNAKTAENLKAFVKRVMKDAKKENASAESESGVTQMDPLRALVRGVLSADVGDARADEALAVIDKEFCDLNELRVATELELQDMLGSKYPEIDKRAMKIVAILNAIFEKEGTLNLARLKDLGKKEIRTFLEALPEMNPYIEAYTMLHGYDSPAVPVDGELIALLADNEAADEGAAPADVQKAVEHQLKADEMGSFHTAVRKLIAAKRKK